MFHVLPVNINHMSEHRVFRGYFLVCPEYWILKLIRRTFLKNVREREVTTVYCFCEVRLSEQIIVTVWDLAKFTVKDAHSYMYLGKLFGTTSFNIYLLQNEEDKNTIFPFNWNIYLTNENQLTGYTSSRKSEFQPYTLRYVLQIDLCVPCLRSIVL